MPRALRFLALGDSTSVGVGAGADGGFPARLARRLKESGRAVGFLNLGESGATSARLVAGPLRRVGKGTADLVTLGIGTNDVWRMVGEDEFARNVETIANALENSGAQIVVCNIADLGLSPAAAIAEQWIGLSPDLVTERIRRMNRHLDALANRPGFRVVDLFSASREALPNRPELFSPDGFHPSAQGYDHWADVAWPAVEAAASAIAQ